MSTNEILDSMVSELKQALLAAGLGPKNPPDDNGKPPSEMVWAEYLRRGGSSTSFKSSDEFTAELVRRVGE